ncbi:hypothetical protein [Leucobacter luti]|uniref:hypothetical protein n=1 Tax=Leucobacter luti TaxID=340320 RepID=UPI001060E3F7|nr:hypothetical protein [Leucobacter luti]
MHIFTHTVVSMAGCSAHHLLNQHEFRVDDGEKQVETITASISSATLMFKDHLGKSASFGVGDVSKSDRTYR